MVAVSLAVPRNCGNNGNCLVLNNRIKPGPLLEQGAANYFNNLSDRYKASN